jgi:signal recognition particle subunit SRP54
MLETIQKGFRTAKNRLKGYREISESNIEDALKDIRMSLLEADVEFHVVKSFLARVKEKALGELVLTKVEHKGKKLEATPGEHFIKICQDELESLMGPVETSLKFAAAGVTKIMMVGLQGSGKTTTAGKLARLIEKDHDRKVCLVAGDIYRPAAVDQLKVLGERLGIPVYHRPGATPVEMCAEAVPYARQHGCTVVIFDTAGRLALDDELMRELEGIKSRTSPENVLFVADAMIGQDVVNTAAEFNRRVGIDGVVLTKLDGDARGGAALSIKEVTGKPIKFVGIGEGLDKLEEFRPEGLASRILGFGDIVGLMKDFEEVVDERKAEEDAKKILSGRFNMTHFLDQIRMIKKMGSLKDVFEKLPFFGDGLPEGVNLDDKELVKVEAMIQSMTKQERRDPDVIDESRARRIAKGSGRQEKEVSELITRFKGMRQMMGQLGQSSGLLGNIPGVKQMKQLKQMQNMNLGDLFGGGGGMPGMPGGAGGFGNMDPAALARQARALQQAGVQLPPEVANAAAMLGGGAGKAGQSKTGAAGVSPEVKKERRKKEKLARQARKKSRKK